MIGRFKQFYSHLPPVMQSVAASLYGWRLTHWRYGKETAGLVDAARDREKWGRAEWDPYRSQQLSVLLKQARERVPFYREYWDQHAGKGEDQPWMRLENWPLLTKAQVREHGPRLVVDGTDPSRLHYDATSGSTGTPLVLWHSRETSVQWYALMEARWRGWYGVTRSNRWAILGGQIVAPFDRKRPPYWVWNRGMNQLYLSSYHISKVSTPEYLEAIRAYNVEYIIGYASSLTSLALYARELGLTAPKLRVVISNAETFSTFQRDLVRSVFQCEVRDSYGMAEMVCAASECEAGVFHLWPETGIHEILDDDSNVRLEDSHVGRLVCTGFLNPAMPLIRYEVGDRCAIRSSFERCACGRTLPVLSSIDGRQEAVIVLPDGRRIGRLDGAFKSNLPICAVQIIQTSPEDLRVLVEPAAGYSKDTESRILSGLRDRVGTLRIEVIRVDEIPRSANGKLRSVLSQMKTNGNNVTTTTTGSRGVRKPTSSKTLRLYHSLPPLGRDVLASIHGYGLRRSRYSAESQSLVQDTLARDAWSMPQWNEWTQSRVTELLGRAIRRVPHYREHWVAKGWQDGRDPVPPLPAWPVLNKQLVRLAPERFLADDVDASKMEMVTTSGTTGTPLKLWRSRPTNQRWYAIYETRVRRWHGLGLSDAWGHLGGQPVVPFEQSAPPYWVWNRPLRQLYLSCMHISPKSAPHYLDAIEGYNLKYLLGYSSSLALLAHAALESGRHIPLKVVLTDSEALLDSQRTVIEAAFQCPARQTYGMSEIACAASECDQGCLHVWPDVGVTELLDPQDVAVGPGQAGRIITTGLINADMPLIRYDTQDMAEWSSDTPNCSCGRLLPRFRKLLGREDDVLLTRDGRRVVQVDRIFDTCFDMREAQIIQEALGRFTIKVAPGPRWTEEDAVKLSSALADLVGEADITVETVSGIEKTWAGKYRIILSKLPKS